MRCPDHSRRTMKRVRFAETLETSKHSTLALDDYSKKEHLSCWWKYNEMTENAWQAKENASRLSEFDGRVLHVLEVAFQGAQLLADRVEDNSDEALLEHSLSDPKAYLGELQQWSINCTPQRGLERFASAYIQLQMSRWRRDHRKTALNPDSLGGNPKDLAELCRRSSNNARIMARFLGYADYEAASEIYNTNLPIQPQHRQSSWRLKHLKEPKSIRSMDGERPTAAKQGARRWKALGFRLLNRGKTCPFTPSKHFSSN